ncbi:oligosaccharide flippase family protein [Cyanobacterium aponinum AL20118]|uniref:Oligosaccharide flippase family protein n=1 Tax=Cyanobacterium aponinum AL20115 TaxID=3090662 RepID=A0AAF1C5Z9_9CHRO|nr:oligosaccharide flippase family protein [Cyanobacterium aponinum]WPF89305.1 oligosaccharide flippase family protein [Cyanobacterium aponinum AL20115]
MSSLKQLAIKGTMWTLIGYGGSQVLRLGSNLILTRLLVPELFGLMALVNTFITGLNLFSDIGINPSIVRSERGEDPDFLNTAWTLQVIRGFGLWIGCWLIAFPVSQFYDEPKLIWLITIVGFNTILSGFNSTSLAVLNRKIEIGKLTLIEITTQITSLTVMIIWAFFQPTIWALVIGTLMSNIVKLSWSHYISPIHHRFTWNQDCLKELVTFGRWIFISTAMTFLASQADRLILGKLVSIEMLGVYTIALTFADIPKQVAGKVSDKIIFPLISQNIFLPRKQLKAKILDKRFYLLLISAILIAILFSFGDVLINILYDERYISASWMLPFLALGLWPLILSLTIDKILFALGNPKFVSLGNIVKFIYMIVLLPWMIKTYGILGGIIVIAFNDIPFYLVVTYGLYKENFVSLLQDLKTTIILIMLSLILSLGRFIFGFGFSLSTITNLQ